MSKFIPQIIYNQFLQSMPLACVDIAIVANGSVLLVKRNDAPAKDEWWLPGGRVFKNEMMKETAHRKAIEEVGIDCHVGPIVHTAETIFPDGPNGIPVHSINSCFLLYPKNKIPKINLDSHSSKFKWINKIEECYHPYVIKCLQGAGF